jgi:hypothetical protein
MSTVTLRFPRPSSRRRRVTPARTDQPYTLSRWRVKAGHEDAFLAAWNELAEYFHGLPLPPGQGILLQSVDDPRLFYSFGPWMSMSAVQAMRADPRSLDAYNRLMELCDEAEPGAFHVVATSR